MAAVPGTRLFGVSARTGWPCVFFLFKSNSRGSHIPYSWLVHAGCVSVATIHPSRTSVPGSFESIGQNACVHLGVYSHLQELLGNGVRTLVNSKGKIPSTRGSDQGQTHNAASHKTASPIRY